VLNSRSYAQRCAIQEQEVFESLVADLCGGDFVRKGSVIRALLIVQRCRSTFNRWKDESAKRSPDNHSIRPRARRSSQIRRLGQVVRFLIENGDITELAFDVCY
jgi:hypothetical protein